MKTRIGFVSNSSSACFVVEIKQNEKDFETFLLKNFPQFFKLELLIEQLEKDLKEYLESLEKYNKSVKENEEAEKKGLKKPHSGMYKLWISRVLNKIDLVKDILSKKELKIKDAFQYFDYEYSKNVFNLIEITGWTPMWNNEEDMGELLYGIYNLLKKDNIIHRLIVSDD